MEKLIDRTYEEIVKNPDINHTINDGQDVYDILSKKVGTAHFYFVRLFYYKNGVFDVVGNNNYSYKLFAILDSENNFYVVSSIYSYKLDSVSDLYKDKIKTIGDYISDCLDKFEHYYIANYYNHLVGVLSTEERDSWDEKHFIAKVRRIVIGGQTLESQIPKFDFSYSNYNDYNVYDKFIKCLCGLMTLNDVAIGYVETYKKRLQNRRNLQYEIETAIKNKTYADNWEIVMGKALSSLEAKTVTVSFKYFGNTMYNVKIDKYSLLTSLINKEFIGYSGFANTYTRDNVRAMINDENYPHKYITKITYRGKTIYSNEDSNETV